jgi:hypothetical protein
LLSDQTLISFGRISLFSYFTPLLQFLKLSADEKEIIHSNWWDKLHWSRDNETTSHQPNLLEPTKVKHN